MDDTDRTGGGDLLLALAGDALICRRVSASQNEGFLELVDVLRAADVTVLNAECTFQDGADFPAFVAGGGRGGTYMASPPHCIDELRWMGVDMVSSANNHAADFAEGGILTNLRLLERAGMPSSGTGRTLTDSTAPTYLDTAQGRIALVAASDWGPRGAGDLPYPPPLGALGSDPSRAYPVGRPGINLVRFDVDVGIDREARDSLERLASQLGWQQAKEARRTGGGHRDVPLTGPLILGQERDDEGSYYFMGTRFTVVDSFGVTTVPWQVDLERNSRWIREARRQADWVIVSLHDHGASTTRHGLPQHTEIFARSAVDAGADVVFTHGTNRGTRVEIYRDRPIVYCLGPLITQNSQITTVPPEAIERWGLDRDQTPADYQEARDTRIGDAPTPAAGTVLPSTFATVSFRGGRLDNVRIHALGLGWRSLPRPRQGLPSLLDDDAPEAASLLGTVQDLSRAYGVDLAIEGAQGVVGVASPATLGPRPTGRKD